jgi:hypothetical protein
VKTRPALSKHVFGHRYKNVIEFGFQIILKIAVWLFGFVDPMLVYNLVVSSRENSKHYLLVSIQLDRKRTSANNGTTRSSS